MGQGWAKQARPLGCNILDSFDPLGCHSGGPCSPLPTVGPGGESWHPFTQERRVLGGRLDFNFFEMLTAGDNVTLMGWRALSCSGSQSGIQTCSIRTTWELARNANSRSHLDP